MKYDNPYQKLVCEDGNWNKQENRTRNCGCNSSSCFLGGDCPNRPVISSDYKNRPHDYGILNAVSATQQVRFRCVLAVYLIKKTGLL